MKPPSRTRRIAVFCVVLPLVVCAVIGGICIATAAYIVDELS